MIMPPTKMEIRNLLADFASDDMYVVFTHDYEDYILTGFKITGEGLRLPLLLDYLRTNHIPILSVKASPVPHEWYEDEWILWWDILIMKYGNEN
jgi:hypothetical protein